VPKGRIWIAKLLPPNAEYPLAACKLVKVETAAAQALYFLGQTGQFVIRGTYVIRVSFITRHAILGRGIVPRYSSRIVQLDWPKGTCTLEYLLGMFSTMLTYDLEYAHALGESRSGSEVVEVAFVAIPGQAREAYKAKRELARRGVRFKYAVDPCDKESPVPESWEKLGSWYSGR
jgi:hypothetical protein